MINQSRRYYMTGCVWARPESDTDTGAPPIPEPVVVDADNAHCETQPRWRLIQTNVTQVGTLGEHFLFTYTWER